MRKNSLNMGLVLLMLLAALTSRADYPIGKGRTAIVGTYNYFYTSKYFDQSSKIISYPPGDKFTSQAYSLTMMHGIGRKLDFSISAPFTMQEIINNGVKTSNSGIGDVNIGLSLHFPSLDYKKYFTIKGNLILPAYQNNQNLSLGYASKGAQFGLNYSFKPYEKGYAIIEAVYTRYFDYEEGPNQYRGSIILGKMLDENTSLTFNFYHQISRSINTAFNPNVAANKNFSGGNLNVSIGRRINRMITPTIQGFCTLYGNNMGLGMGASFFVTVRIP